MYIEQYAFVSFILRIFYRKRTAILTFYFYVVFITIIIRSNQTELQT